MIGESGADFGRLQRDLPAIQASLREGGLDGWLLFDVYGRNPVSARLLGLASMTRRYFVLVPAQGEPVALTHGIEQGPWDLWPWRKEVYVAWPELDEKLGAMLRGRGKVAMDYMPGDAVPAMDLVPGGVVELVQRAGSDVVTSGDLVTRFYAAWSADDLASHRRAAAALAQVAQAAFVRLAQTLAGGAVATEGDLRDWVVADLHAHDVVVDADCIPAIGPNAANPHYAPIGRGAAFHRGDVVLLDLWGKESESSVYADQTWMAFMGERVPERPAALFAAIRDGRDAAVAFLRAHRHHVFLITIDIGANDPEQCGARPNIAKIVSCIGTGIPDAITHLTTIMARLKAAADPGVRIVGMNYYLPALAEWRSGLPGHAIAWVAERLAASYNDLLALVYTRSGARVADVFAAFDTTDFARKVTLPGIGTVPRNVARICQWTWQCAAPPRGPNQHANQAGYQVISRTVLQAAGL